MGTPIVESGKKGREAKYSLADVHSVATVLTGEKDGKTYTVDSVKYTVKDISAALAVFQNSEGDLFDFLSEWITFYAQRSDRQRLSQKMQGPAKDIIRAAKAMIDVLNCGAEEAINGVLTVAVSKGTVEGAWADANRADLIKKLSDKVGPDEDENDAQ